MITTKDVVLAVLGATSALSALVLVFLGLIATTLQSLAGGSTLKAAYKWAGGVTFLAFLLGVACIGLSIWWLLLSQPHGVYVAVMITFLAQLFLLAVAAVQVVIQMIFRQ